MNKRQTVLIAVLAAMLAVAAAWTYDEMATQRQAAHNAAADLASCRQLAEKIQEYTKIPTFALEGSTQDNTITGAIESAARTADIDPSCLDRIMPERPRRLGDTVYKETPTHVLLKNVTLKQLVTLIHTATADGQGLAARAIRINAPRPEDTGPLWMAELTLTYLIYDPPKTK